MTSRQVSTAAQLRRSGVSDPARLVADLSAIEGILGTTAP